MANIDGLLEPDNLNDDKKSEKKSNKIKKSSTSATQSRLADLKELMKADPVQLDTDNLLPSRNDFPESENIKYIDYDQEKKNHHEFANQAIGNIIKTYIKSENLLDSPRLKDLKQNDVLKYSRLLLMLSISESNMIRLQESIDGGDMSKEMFDSINKAQQEVRSNIKAVDEHLNKCENYWKNYSEMFGFENEEEKIVQETSIKDNGEDENKRVIVDMSKLTNIIHERQEQIKKEEEAKKKKEDE